MGRSDLLQVSERGKRREPGPPARITVGDRRKNVGVNEIVLSCFDHNRTQRILE